MTGWSHRPRRGLEHLIKAMATLQSQSTTSSNAAGASLITPYHIDNADVFENVGTLTPMQEFVIDLDIPSDKEYETSRIARGRNDGTIGLVKPGVITYAGREVVFLPFRGGRPCPTSPVTIR